LRRSLVAFHRSDPTLINVMRHQRLKPTPSRNRIRHRKWANAGRGIDAVNGASVAKKGVTLLSIF
jgi:hypothetical protein